MTPVPPPPCPACGGACAFAVGGDWPRCAACGQVATRLTPDGMLAAAASCEGLAAHLAKQFRQTNPKLKMADLVEAAEYGVRLCAVNFDPSRGCQFTTPAWRYAVNELIDFCRRESACGMRTPHDRRVAFPKVYQLQGNSTDPSDPYSDPPSRERSPADDGSPLECADFWEAALRTLPARDRGMVLAVYRDGVSPVDVGRACGLSRERVRQIVLRAMAKLRLRADLRQLAGPLPAASEPAAGLPLARAVSGKPKAAGRKRKRRACA